MRGTYQLARYEDQLQGKRMSAPHPQMQWRTVEHVTHDDDDGASTAVRLFSLLHALHDDNKRPVYYCYIRINVFVKKSAEEGSEERRTSRRAQSRPS